MLAAGLHGQLRFPVVWGGPPCRARQPAAKESTSLELGQTRLASFATCWHPIVREPVPPTQAISESRQRARRFLLRRVRSRAVVGPTLRMLVRIRIGP